MKKIFLGTLALGLLSITACEKQRGCTDPNSINFDSSAEENEGLSGVFKSNLNIKLRTFLLFFDLICISIMFN